MTSVPTRDEFHSTLRLVYERSLRYLSSIDAGPVRNRQIDSYARTLAGTLPEVGLGAFGALRLLADVAPLAAMASSGPSFLHWATGGVTAASLGGDWLTSLLDQNGRFWASSPLAIQLELLSIDWLKELFGLPAEWHGALTTGATMGTFAGLAAARQWLGEQYGVDVNNSGLWRLPPVTVIASSYVHPTTTKAVGMLGFGRESVHVLADNDTGGMDINRLRQALDRAGDSPVIVILTAGDVDTGRFDPIREVTVACRSRNAWVHVDGAFGLFARVSPSRRYLADGVELAQSVSVDAHKWLNVPFDSGLVYVRDIRYLESAFATTAAFLDDPGLTLMDRCPENSRRARGIAIWASLMAYGRSGFQELVDRHLCLANRLGRQVKGAPDFELMAPVSLNVVAFRWKPEDLPESEVDTLNQDIAKILLEDGQIFVGSLARINGRVGFRAIILNWRTREEDIDNIIPRVRAAGLIHRNRKTSF